MRIVSGRHGGRRLHVPKNNKIRPTSDKIRGAIFNMLSAREAIDDARVLDGFCGTGALGLEALSRGAAQALFIDTSKASLSLARENVSALQEEGVSDFLLRDTSALGPNKKFPHGFSLIFLDPPYHKGLVSAALSSLQRGGWIANHAWIMCETEKSAQFPLSGFQCDAEKVYGDTKITILRKLANHAAIKQSQ